MTTLQHTPRYAAASEQVGDAWAVPQEILRRADLRGEAKLCWLYLWHQAGSRADTVRTTAPEIAAVLGGSERSARRWLAALAEVGAVDVLDRQPLRLYIHDPAELATGRVLRADPQASLFAEQAPEAPIGSFSVVKPAAVVVPKPPAVSVPQPPTSYLHISQDSAGKRPWERLSTGATAAVLVPKPPRSSMEPLEDRTLQEPLTHRTPWNHGEPEREPAHVSAALADALADFNRADTGRRDRLKTYILERVADPAMHASIAGQAADLVTAGVPLADLLAILDQLDDLRSRGKLRTAGGFFHTKVRSLAAQHGLTWRRRQRP